MSNVRSAEERLVDTRSHVVFVEDPIRVHHIVGRACGEHDRYNGDERTADAFGWVMSNSCTYLSHNGWVC